MNSSNTLCAGKGVSRFWNLIWDGYEDFLKRHLQNFAVLTRADWSRICPCPVPMISGRSSMAKRFRRRGQLRYGACPKHTPSSLCLVGFPPMPALLGCHRTLDYRTHRNPRNSTYKMYSMKTSIARHFRVGTAWILAVQRYSPSSPYMPIVLKRKAGKMLNWTGPASQLKRAAITNQMERTDLPANWRRFKQPLRIHTWSLAQQIQQYHSEFWKYYLPANLDFPLDWEFDDINTLVKLKHFCIGLDIHTSGGLRSLPPTNKECAVFGNRNSQPFSLAIPHGR